jgi:CRISPR-associated endonuclease/helicase Cas3
MAIRSYVDFFRAVAGNAPLPYQRRLVEGPWPDCLIVPTGLGKTAAVICAWLHRRLNGDPETPRRLVYCLPMRVLVEQTERSARAWSEACRDGFGLGPSVHVLMGGAVDDHWVEHPEGPAIIIGTQDMLLSRALMRGYGMSRYRWPIDFALLHNDAFWIFDEIQLMGVGLTTSSQLEGFRRMEELRPLLPGRSLWMSATLNPEWLGSVDFRHDLATLRSERLNEEDQAHEVVGQRTHAPKTLARANTSAQSAVYETALAGEILEAHRPGKTTLAIVNRVDRAQEIYRCLRAKLQDGEPELLLIHSRFRARERRSKEAQLPGPREHRDLIVVATQAIEAGVDLTSAVLFTELAPWASLVQRFGRCNRYGELNNDSGGRIFWIEGLVGDPLPYETEELAAASVILDQLSSASPADLPQVKGTLPFGQVIRRKDFIELFNTDPDLSGFDVDVSPFIRDAEDVDVRVLWRAFEKAPAPDAARPQRDELCPVSIARFRDFFQRISKKGLQAFVWDTLADVPERRRPGRWARLDRNRLYPGLEIMLAADAGGYDPDVGFDVRATARVEPLAPVEASAPESMEGDEASEIGAFVQLSWHLADVEAEARALCQALGLVEGNAITQTARWHDVGKAHEVFQDAIGDCLRQSKSRPAGALAKSACTQECREFGCGIRRYTRAARQAPTAEAGAPPEVRRLPCPGFRHELASALAWLAHGGGSNKDLIAYLIAAHHGKVRMGLRALPIERGDPEKPERRFARGIWDGDVLPELVFADGTVVPQTSLQLAIMELGGGESGEESWTARAQRLLSDNGPFRLAFLETLVRLADWRASKREQGKANEREPGDVL